eukprot:UN06886
MQGFTVSMHTMSGTITTEYMISIGGQLDILSNCICIALSYSYFEPLYKRICNCVDLQCRKCCRRCVGTVNVA